MRRFFWLINCILLLYTATPITGKAQFTPTPVVKSSQKILHQGKVYFIHSVKAGQTLYSISRAYGVTPQDIAAANPNLALEVISTGQALKIPSISALDELSESYFGLSEKDFFYHKIEPLQTISYLTRRYSVKAEDIYKYNPGSKDILQIGQTIKIPKPHVLKTPTQLAPISQPIQKDTVNTYFVKAGDTLYSLAKKHGVSVADFIEINPNLRWGLKQGMLLNIPGRSYIPVNPFDVPDTLIELKNQITQYSIEQCDSLSNTIASTPLKVVLMLPFHYRETIALDSIKNDTIRLQHPFNRKRNIGRSFIEFYQGFLIALDSLKSMGQSISLFTYDTRYDSAETARILKDIEIIRPDIIVGPVKKENIKLVSVYSDSNQTPLILPLSRADKNVTPDNEHVVTFLPNFKAEIELASDFISKFHNQNIILIHNQDSLRMDNLNMLRKNLFAHFSSKESYEKALFKEIRFNDTLQPNLSHALRSDLENIVLIISNNEAYVSNVLGLLTIQDEAFNIRAFGLPSWQKFNNLRVDQLHILNTMLYSPYFIDYAKPSTQRFIHLCRTKLGHEPYRTISSGTGFNFTYIGYETGLIFTKAFHSYGVNFLSCMCSIHESLPQLDYEFKQNTEGGFVVNALNIVNYTKDYQLVRVPFKSSETLTQEQLREIELKNSTVFDKIEQR